MDRGSPLLDGTARVGADRERLQHHRVAPAAHAHDDALQAAPLPRAAVGELYDLAGGSGRARQPLRRSRVRGGAQRLLALCDDVMNHDVRREPSSGWSHESPTQVAMLPMASRTWPLTAPGGAACRQSRTRASARARRAGDRPQRPLRAPPGQTEIGGCSTGCAGPAPGPTRLRGGDARRGFDVARSGSAADEAVGRAAVGTGGRPTASNARICVLRLSRRAPRRRGRTRRRAVVARVVEAERDGESVGKARPRNVDAGRGVRTSVAAPRA